MDPVDPRTAFTRIHRPRAAHDHHRSVIAPGVVDRHRGMLKANHVVDNGGHDLTRRFGITMRNRDGDLFVAAENHLRVGLTAALVIDERIVNTAKTRPRVESNIFNAENFQKINDEIRSITRGHSYLLKRLFTANSERDPSPLR